MIRFILCKFDETTCPDWADVLLDVHNALQRHGGEAMLIQDVDQAGETLRVRCAILAGARVA